MTSTEALFFFSSFRRPSPVSFVFAKNIGKHFIVNGWKQGSTTKNILASRSIISKSSIYESFINVIETIVKCTPVIVDDINNTLSPKLLVLSDAISFEWKDSLLICLHQDKSDILSISEKTNCSHYPWMKKISSNYQLQKNLILNEVFQGWIISDSHMIQRLF